MDCGQRRAVESLTLNVITYFIYLYINVFFEKFSSKILYYSRCITRHAGRAAEGALVSKKRKWAPESTQLKEPVSTLTPTDTLQGRYV